MSDWPTVTVAILSHRRPHLLARVLGAVSQLDYPSFEIVVVGDQPDLGGAGLPDGLASQIRYERLEEPNISRARNTAIRLAAGEIVAFCDDDAAPEPDWLKKLARAFRDPKVASASGTVLASDGLSVEWQGCSFSSTAREWRGPPAPEIDNLIAEGPSQVAEDRYVGLIGVNSAFRRQAVLEAGGFDEAYAYFLEETDLALRLARAGWSAALVPGAVVHHLREQNAARGSARVPRNLFQVAASKAHFCHRHMPPDEVGAELARFREVRLAELDPFVRLGAVRADGLKRLEHQLDRGLADGASRETVLPLSPDMPSAGFTAFRRPVAGPALRIALVSGWGIGQIRRIRRLAQRLAGAGHMVSCFSYHSGPQRARVMFSEGVWLHHGGTWRLDQRSANGLPMMRRSARAEAEMRRVAAHRDFDVVIRPGKSGTGNGAALILTGQTGPLIARGAQPDKPLSPRMVEVLRTALEAGRSEDLAAAQVTESRRNGTAGRSVGYF